MKEVNALVKKCFEKICVYRSYLHAHPELAGNEVESSAYIAGALREMGLEPRENVGGYGVTAVITGTKGAGKCIGLRADFDALPITENTGLACSSQNPGVMHACGHDMHAAMLLGAAYVLNEWKDSFAGSVKLVFQPAEENVVLSGARSMIADGVLEDPRVDAIVAQHVWPSIDAGKVGLRDGAMMAASDRFFITVKGSSTHGSEPQNGVDAIVIAGHVLCALQTIVSRNVGPLDNAVVSVGNIHGGGAYNVICDEVKMEGTCRNLNPTVRDAMPEQIERVVRGVTDSMGGSYEFRYVRGYSPAVNDHDMFSLVRDAVLEAGGQDALVIPQTAALGGEDFSFYCERVPGAMFWLGCGRPDRKQIPLHNAEFDPGEDIIPLGVEILVTSALKFLEQKSTMI
ncbi:MAG: amidohydrolase [Ruminococcaceae bacterium]|nr:amidohydrolase [Oscillospiraceae bacterium]